MIRMKISIASKMFMWVKKVFGKVCLTNITFQLNFFL